MQEYLEKSYGRVTALKINKYEEGKIVHPLYLPQVEIISYRPSDGETVESQFALFNEEEYTSELEAIKAAVKFRDYDSIKREKINSVSDKINDIVFKYFKEIYGIWGQPSEKNTEYVDTVQSRFYRDILAVLPSSKEEA